MLVAPQLHEIMEILYFEHFFVCPSVYNMSVWSFNVTLELVINYLRALVHSASGSSDVRNVSACGKRFAIFKLIRMR